MAMLFWDASALVKRYTREVGSDTADALFGGVSLRTMATTVWGYAETYSALLRKLNSSRLDLPTFTAAASALQDEVIDNPEFGLLLVDDDSVLAGVSLMKKHNVNASDAAILATVLEYVHVTASGGSDCVLIAADRRLLRAAAAERLETLDPETLIAADVPTFLAAHQIS
jgi:predicted nucleic acid-binding protein